MSDDTSPNRDAITLDELLTSGEFQQVPLDETSELHIDSTGETVLLALHDREVLLKLEVRESLRRDPRRDPRRDLARDLRGRAQRDMRSR